MKLGRVWLPIVQSWGFYPGIASICLRFSHDELGPCYSHGPLTYNDWLMILGKSMKYVSRWGTATLYPTTGSAGQSLLCKLKY